MDQKTTNKNLRSTVGTVTEIYDYLRLLYARVGIPYRPVCGREIASQSVSFHIVDHITAHDEGTRSTIMAPNIKGRKGYIRVAIHVSRGMDLSESDSMARWLGG